MQTTVLVNEGFLRLADGTAADWRTARISSLSRRKPCDGDSARARVTEKRCSGNLLLTDRLLT